MIDFQSGGLFARLGPSDPRELAAELAPILVDGELVQLSFRGTRDSVVFTNKRLIAINVQGLTGKSGIIRPCPTARSRLGAWRRRDVSTSTPNSNCGSQDSGRSDSNSRARSTSDPSAASLEATSSSVALSLGGAAVHDSEACDVDAGDVFGVAAG
ncbi:hypothetical protein MARA_32360 [Mycolicibacterium arabiense]|uniref:Bacterial Pleckstrin homology domain-containing protein n=1 Tax=Mycolicibacterium arabiense TaxID=1286181 RepID=A0A7I7RYP7_9MYCO|nr:hypothetical protein MARA_32360 [Mycolicibacterium arabiense]